MKVVIADTSAVNYLVLIDTIEILPRLYRRIVIPDEGRASAPQARRPRWRLGLLHGQTG
jgi:predicted nucleic acid-binding protein